MSLITSEKKFSNPKRACKHFISLVHPKLSCLHPTKRRTLNPHHRHYYHYHRNGDHNSQHDHQHYFHGHPPRNQQASHSQLGVYSKECMIENGVDDAHQDHDSDGDSSNDDDNDDEDDHEANKVQMHEVDAKAEAFIKNFKQVLRLERQKSVEEFYAMLARGT